MLLAQMLISHKRYDISSKPLYSADTNIVKETTRF